jgi:GMP synthase (glutamine-hydrolysing)
VCKETASLTNHFLEVSRVTYLLGVKDGTLQNARIVKRDITKNRLDLLREADFIANQFIRKHKIAKKVWQFPVVLIPLQFSEGESVVLRPVSSTDGMTAEYTKIPRKLMYELADCLLAIPGIDAVLYDITNKPPATIEWE